MNEYVIEDVSHCEIMWEYQSYKEVMERMNYLRQLWWCWENICPCTSYATCSREYEIIKYAGGIQIDSVCAFEIGKTVDDWKLNNWKG